MDGDGGIRRPASRSSTAGDKPQRYICLCRLSAINVGQVDIGVARPYRNLSRIGVRDMLSYQLWENALTPALRATYNFPGPPYL